MVSIADPNPGTYYLKFWGPSTLGRNATGGNLGDVTEGDLYVKKYVKRYLQQVSPEERIEITIPGEVDQKDNFPESYKFFPHHFGVLRYTLSETIEVCYIGLF